MELIVLLIVGTPIVLAIWLGAAPYHARDLIAWLFARRGRARALGAVCAVYGIVLAVLASTYHNLR